MNGGRKVRVKVVELGLQIANSVTINIKLYLYGKNLCIEFVFFPKVFIEIRENRLRLNSSGGKSLEPADLSN